MSYGPLVAAFVKRGIAFFSYDKRGVGESEGDCCPGDDGDFGLLTADAVGAVESARSYAGIDPAQVGFTGASQAGGLLLRRRSTRGTSPSSPSQARGFFGTALSTSTSDSPAARERKAAALRGGDRKEARIGQTERLRPAPALRKLKAPALWLFGGADRNVPPRQSAAALRLMKTRLQKNWTIIVYPGAGHGLFDSKPTDPRAVPAAATWVRRHVTLAH